MLTVLLCLTLSSTAAHITCPFLVFTTTHYRGLPIPWMLLAFLVYWLVNLYLFPPKPKAAEEGGATN